MYAVLWWYKIIIYTIILLKSVCLADVVGKLQAAICAPSSREISQTVRIWAVTPSSHEFASQFSLRLKTPLEGFVRTGTKFHTNLTTYQHFLFRRVVFTLAENSYGRLLFSSKYHTPTRSWHARFMLTNKRLYVCLASNYTLRLWDCKLVSAWRSCRETLLIIPRIFLVQKTIVFRRRRPIFLLHQIGQSIADLRQSTAC